jgi:hypothetical protein
MGPPPFFDASLPACHGLWTPADLPLLAKADGRVLPSGAFIPSASATRAFSKLFPPFRVCGHPYGLQDALSTLRPSCSPCLGPRLRHGRQTRYGRAASPYPTGTFTLSETPSLLGARTPGMSRALLRVGSMPWFGSHAHCRPPLPTTYPPLLPLSYQETGSAVSVRKARLGW